MFDSGMVRRASPTLTTPKARAGRRRRTTRARFGSPSSAHAIDELLDPSTRVPTPPKKRARGTSSRRGRRCNQSYTDPSLMGRSLGEPPSRARPPVVAPASGRGATTGGPGRTGRTRGSAGCVERHVGGPRRVADGGGPAADDGGGKESSWALQAEGTPHRR